MLTVEPEALTFTEAGNKTFTITGANLTDGTYTITVPEKFTASPATYTVSGGVALQEVTITYAPTENTKATEGVVTVANGDEIDATVALKYYALVTPTVQTTVSTAKTWDIENNVHASADVAAPTETLYANLLDLTFDEAFDATSLLVKSNSYAYRAGNKCAQDGTLKFTTTVPGTVTVDFSDTGGSNGGRKLVVNDETGTVETPKSTAKQTDSFNVEAGDVTIASTDPVRYFKVVFTPTAETVTIPAGKTFATFNSDNILDFTSTTDITAYTAKVSGTTVTLTKVTAPVPANTGLLLRGVTAGATANVTIAASASEPAVNDFVAVTAEDGTTVTTGYILATVDGVQGFYPVNSTSGNHVAKGKAYLATGGSARLSLVFDDGTEPIVTGIDEVRSEMGEVGGDFFDLQGRKVSQPTRGLYIVNGKKVVVK